MPQPVYRFVYAIRYLLERAQSLEALSTTDVDEWNNLLPARVPKVR